MTKKRISDAELMRALQAQFKDKAGLLEYLDKLDAQDSLHEYVKLMWHTVEPVTPFVDGWHIQAICEHLEAVTRGEIKRLLINIPPGSLKSLLVNCFWPSWEWGPKALPHLRTVSASYNDRLPIRDNGRFKQIITSPLYRKLWGTAFQPTSLSQMKVENNHTGWREASSIGGLGTGIRGDRFVADDPNNVRESESDKIRDGANQWFREVVPTRLNSLKDSAIVVIQQRTHEMDVSGLILSSGMPYDHLMIPMEFEPMRRVVTSIGWTDPRNQENELMCPERFGPKEVDQLKKDLGEYASASQLQQLPVPRGGTIIKNEWWKEYKPQLKEGQKLFFPAFDYVVASLDTAYTEEQENDPSALTVWGIWRDEYDHPKIMLIDAWEKRLTLHGPPAPDNVSRIEEQKHWGLVEWVAFTCRRWKADRLIIESSAAGLSVVQEMRRLYTNEKWGIQMVKPSRDKRARLYSIEPVFSAGLVYAPVDRQYASMVIKQVCAFPRAPHDDLTDSTTQAIAWLRDNGLIVRGDERDVYLKGMYKRVAPQGALYDV